MCLMAMLLVLLLIGCRVDVCVCGCVVTCDGVAIVVCIDGDVVDV